jgi:hypothetical protein
VHVLLEGIELGVDLLDLDRVGRDIKRAPDVVDLDDRRGRARWRSSMPSSQ